MVRPLLLLCGVVEHLLKASNDCSRTSSSQATSSSMICWIISSSLSMSTSNQMVRIQSRQWRQRYATAPTRQTVEHLLCATEEESVQRVLAWDGWPLVAKRAAREIDVAVKSLGAENKGSSLALNEPNWAEQPSSPPLLGCVRL
jgi:hypothetical protein